MATAGRSSGESPGTADGVRPLKSAGLYAAVAGTIVASLVVTLRLWTKDLTVPLTYGGDGLFWTVMVKAVSEGGVAGHVSRLGTPFGLDVADWPQGMPLDFSILALLARATGSPGMALNFYWMLSV